MTGRNPLEENPRVSVLMTIYNAAPFLRESIDSIIAQSFPNWELIAIENGSTDGAPAILAGYKDPRIRVFVFPQNIGRTPALVFALSQARGEYIAIHDADDVAYPQRFSRQVEFLDNDPETVLVGSWYQLMDKKGRVFDTWEPPIDSNALYQCLGWRNPIGHSSAMFRQETAVIAGGYSEEYIYAQDFALVLALVRYGRLAVIGEHLCKLRIFSANMSNSSQHAGVSASEGLRLLKYAGETLSLSKKTRCMNRCSIAKFECRYGRANFFHGRIFLGLRMMIWGILSFIVLKIRIFIMGKE